MMHNKALIVQEKGVAKVVDAPVPRLRDDYILIEVRAIALNPTDWKHIDYISQPGNWCGCDYAGVVVEVGSAVTKPFKKGDRICGAAHGGNLVYKEDGAFAKFITAKGDLQMSIPSNLSFEQAATLACGLITVGLGLYDSLRLPFPPTKILPGEPILIYGGATATGALAIQFAKLSGCNPVITTASSSNFEYLKDLGADYVFDYHDAEACIKDIRNVVGDSLTKVLDCVGAEQICISSLSAAKDSIFCTIVSLKPLELSNPNIKSANVAGYLVIGEETEMAGEKIDADMHAFEFGKAFINISQKLLEDGKIRPHKMSVNEGGVGLDGALAGLQLMREGKVSGRKLVYSLE